MTISEPMTSTHDASDYRDFSMTLVATWSHISRLNYNISQP
jgi:hypothetical protein